MGTAFFRIIKYNIGLGCMLRTWPVCACVTHMLPVLALQVMASPVVGFKAVEKVQTVVETLRTTKFNGFPVFPADRQVLLSVKLITLPGCT